MLCPAQSYDISLIMTFCPKHNPSFQILLSKFSLENLRFSFIFTNESTEYLAPIIFVIASRFYI